MSTEPDNTDDEGDDLDDYSHHTKWAFLVCPQTKDWIVTRVTPNSEIGEYEVDMSRVGKDWVIAAFFDPSVEEILDAMKVISGNSIEGSSIIEGLLSGVCRSFIESQIKLKELEAKLPSE